MSERVWFDFGSGPESLEADSLRELNVAIDAIQWAMARCGLDDYAQYNDEDELRPVECDNCDWYGLAGDVNPIKDLQERIEPGGEVPVGECPSCGALAYLTVEEPSQTRPDR